MNEQTVATVKSDLPKAVVCSITLEVARTSFWGGYVWHHWVAFVQGVPIKASAEWRNNLNDVSFLESWARMQFPNFVSPHYENKRIRAYCELSAPAVWKLVHELEAEGWRPIYNSDGNVDSMVKGEFEVVDGKIIPLDEKFSLE